MHTRAGRQSKASPPSRCPHPLAHGLSPTPSSNGHWIFLRCGAPRRFETVCDARYRVPQSLWEAEILRRQESATLTTMLEQRDASGRRGAREDVEQDCRSYFDKHINVLCETSVEKQAKTAAVLEEDEKTHMNTVVQATHYLPPGATGLAGAGCDRIDPATRPWRVTDDPRQVTCRRCLRGFSFPAAPAGTQAFGGHHP